MKALKTVWSLQLSWCFVCVGLLIILCVPGISSANDIQPRLFTNIPLETNFVGLSYTRSEGNVSVDPNVALDVEAELNTFVFSYSRSFGVMGKSALVTAALPVADLKLTGKVQGQAESLEDRAVSDPKIRVAVNILGAPALSPQAFAKYRQKTILGVNLEIVPPLGDYDPEKTINFGSNRWSVSPEIGVSHRKGRFTIEGAGSLIWFSNNDEFLGDSKLEQETVLIARANLLYHFDRPGTWIGIGSMYLWGGETTVDGTEKNDLQQTSRSGVGLSVPIGQRHNLFFKFSTGVTSRIGADFNNYNIAYSYRF
jgi:hypothetical protein